MPWCSHSGFTGFAELPWVPAEAHIRMRLQCTISGPSGCGCSHGRAWDDGRETVSAYASTAFNLYSMT